MSRWIDELASMLPQGERRKPWRALLMGTPEGLAVHLRDGKGNPRHVGLLKPDGTHQFGKNSDRRRLMRLAKQPDQLVLRLPADQVIRKAITIPAGAHDVIAPIVGNQIELISPWPKERALYDWEVLSQPKDAPLNVDVVVAGKTVIEELMQCAAAHKLVPDVADAGDDISENTSVNFLRRREDEPVRGRNLVKASLLFATIGALTTGSVGALQVAEQRETLTWVSERAELGAKRAETARRVTGKAARLQARYQQASDEKYRQLPAVIMIEAVSRTLPDGTWLTKLEANGGIIRLAGLSSDAAGLIRLLEASPFFKNAKLAAPVTPASGREQFVIDARAAENLELAEVLTATKRKRINRPRTQRRGSER